MEEQTRESNEKKQVADKKMKEMLAEIEKKSKEAADIQEMLKKKKEEQEKANADLVKSKAELDRVLTETKLKAADVEKSANEIKKSNDIPVTKVAETPRKQETPAKEEKKPEVV